MQMMTAAFAFEKTVQSTAASGETELLYVRVETSPQVGMVTFLLATCLSMISSHLLLAMHRSAAASSTNAVVDVGWGGSDGPDGLDTALVAAPLAAALRSHTFDRLLCLRGKRLSGLAQLFVLLVLGLAAAGVAIGSFMYSFDIILSGYAGELLGDTTTPYSIVSLIKDLPDATPTTPAAIIYAFQAVFGLICLVIPLAWLLQVAVLWAVPMSPSWQRRMRSFAEVLHAWSCLDVFLLTVLVSLLELNQFAAFIIGGECDGLNKLVSQYLGYMVTDSDDGCLQVNTAFEPGYVVLFLASFFCMCVGHFIMFAANAALGAQ